MADTFTLLGYSLLVVFMLINRFGGPQIVYYRVRRISYFIIYMRGPDRRYRKRIFPMSMIQKHSPSMFTYGRGNYLAPEAEAATSEHGAPMWFYAWDEARCIPQYMDTVEVTTEDGQRYTKTEFREKVPPEVVKSGFIGMAASAIAIGNLDEQPQQNKLAWYVVPMIALILVACLATAYYAHDVACVLHARSC